MTPSDARGPLSDNPTEAPHARTPDPTDPAQPRQPEAAILTIGDEILYGQIQDTNAGWLSTRLTESGFRVRLRLTVGDTHEAITQGLHWALTSADLVLITGGLGPTKDDVTKKTLAHFFSMTLQEHPEAMAHLEQYFTRRSRPLNALNRTQALLPDGARYIVNERGTAPGMWFDTGTRRPAGAGRPTRQVIVSMPGVPKEMEGMFDARILPLAQKTFQTLPIVHGYVQTVGVPESDLALKIASWEEALPETMHLAYLPSRGKVRLRLTAAGPDPKALEALIAAETVKLPPLLGRAIYSFKDEDLVTRVAEMLLTRQATISSAESCTGGEFAARFVRMPGASDTLIGGMVTYSVEAKAKLGVEREVIEESGVVSAPVAEAMAEASRAYFGTTFAVSSTGVAGPGPDADGNPPGTIYIALAGPEGVSHRLLSLTPDRDTNIELAVTHMFNMLRLRLDELPVKDK